MNNVVMKRKIFGGAVVITLACLAGVSCRPDSDAADEVRIGVLFPLSGDAASYGEKGQKAIELALEEVRAAKTLGERKIRVIYEDSKADSTTAASAMQKLANIDKVCAVVGDIVSAGTLAAAPIAERSKIILIAPTSSAPAITDAGVYIYRTWPSDLAEGKAIAECALKRGFKKAAILHLNNDYGVSISKVFQETFTRGGGRIEGVNGYLADSDSHRTALTKIKQSAVDAIYVAGYYADSAAIIRQARELGMKTQFFGATAVEDEKFLELGGDAVEGVIYPLATGFDPGSSARLTNDFVKRFQERYGYEPGWVEAQCYDAFMLVCKAIGKKPAGANGSSIRGFFDSMEKYEGVAGETKFDKNGDVVKPVRFKTVKDGKFVALSD